MFKLIQNEYIKIFRKVSTLIIFILVILTSIGLVGLSKYSQIQNAKWEERYPTEDSYDYSGQVKEAKDAPYVGSDKDIDMYQFLMDNKITYASWKTNVTRSMYEYSVVVGEDGKETAEYVMSESDRTKLNTFIMNSDWKACCQYIIDTSKAQKLDENEYWEYQYRIDNNIALPTSFDEDVEWKNMLINSIAFAKAELVNIKDQKDPESLETIDSREGEIAIGLYRLENNIEVNVADIDSEDALYGGQMTMWHVMKMSVSMISLIGLLVIVITGSSLANEFSRGTIKFLLINPVKRWKILTSKYITSLTIGFLMLVIMFVFTSLGSMMAFGTAEVSSRYITFVDGAIKVGSPWVSMIKSYLIGSVNVIVMATLAFAISSLVRSSALAIGVGIFSMLSGSTLVVLLKEGLKQDWARYLVFANTDLNSIIDGTSMFSNQTLGFAIAVLAVHMVVFALVAWDGFVRREV